MSMVQGDQPRQGRSSRLFAALLQQIDGHSVGRIEVNPEIMQGNEGIIGESAATVRGGGFVSIASYSFSYDYAPLSEAGDFGHGYFQSPASTPLI
jgi:hypothetical protein